MRRALLVALVGVALSADTATADVCRYVPPKSAKQERIDDAIAARKQLGLPRGRLFVERLDRDRAANDRGNLILNFPMTVREARYFEDRQRVSSEADRVDKFVH